MSLPADHRYLRLKFALSSYIEPQRNRYAYKLEGIDQDWTHLGTQHELVLNQLPAGRYRLLIKGSDYQNNWTEEPLVIPIHAQEFFYKQTWFYVLIFLVLTLVALFWIRRLRSEKMRLEAEVQSRTEQIRQDKELIEVQAKDLQQLDEVKSRFFTNISHELRTPVTLIATPIEQILRKHAPELSTELNKSLQIIRNNAKRLRNLVEELLELSRLEAGKAQLSTMPVHLHHFCRQLFSAYESGAHLKELNYHFYYELEESLHILTDKKRLEKIINNLLGNALKFTPNNGTVTLTVKQEASDVLIEVADSGRGIPEEDIPHIFDRYFQTKRKNTPLEGGTGIGLALSKELAELMAGSLSVESKFLPAGEVGESGSTFSLRFPLQIATTPEIKNASTLTESIAVVERAQHLAPQQPTNGEQGKILIVEDNPDMQQLLVDLLAEQYHCLVAENGMEAWNMLQNEDIKIQEIQLMLSDIMMPLMDGYALLDNIKSHQRWQQLPVIMLTARAAERDKLQALRMGVDDYLTKPFSPEELLARVHNLIYNYQQRRAFKQAEATPVSIEFEIEASADQELLRSLEELVMEAIDKKLDISTSYLADKLSLGDRTLLRRMKSLTGLSTKQYILEVKLQKSRHLFENKTYHTISEVAYACGFNTPGYFTKQFEKRFGKHPNAYLHATER